MTIPQFVIDKTHCKLATCRFARKSPQFAKKSLIDSDSTTNVRRHPHKNSIFAFDAPRPQRAVGWQTVQSAVDLDAWTPLPVLGLRVCEFGSDKRADQLSFLHHSLN